MREHRFLILIFLYFILYTRYSFIFFYVSRETFLEIPISLIFYTRFSVFKFILTTKSRISCINVSRETYSKIRNLLSISSGFHRFSQVFPGEKHVEMPYAQ